MPRTCGRATGTSRRQPLLPDTRAFIALLHAHEVRYLIVGGEAVILHGYARLTGDVDFFFANDSDNVRRLHDALVAFWEGDVPGIDKPHQLAPAGTIIQFGLPPNRIDLINAIEGVGFEEAWEGRIDTLPHPLPRPPAARAAAFGRFTR